MYIFISVVFCFFGLVTSHPDFDSAEYDKYENSTNYPPTCRSKVFCHSVLLHDVALSGIQVAGQNLSYMQFKLRFPENVILKRYKALREASGGKAPPNEKLLKFVNAHFENITAANDWLPDDYKSETALMGRVKDADYQKLLRVLQKIWKTLLKKMTPDVKQNESRYSMVYVPNGFAVPGGEFQELFYWDSYWVMDGLLLSDMADTVKGMIENFLDLVRRFKFVPNASRVYYLTRCNPPLLIHMMDSYLQHTGNMGFVQKNLELMSDEFEWYQENRAVKVVKDGKSYNMFRYNSETRGPRPETYRRDWEIGQTIQSKPERERYYADIKSAVESGWDFSTRWFKDDKHFGPTLREVLTHVLVPVDLNAILQKNAVLLSKWWYKSGNQHKGKYYKKIADQLLQSIHEVLWREDIGSWLDWDMLTNQHRDSFYPSNMAPLWTESYSMPKDYVSAKVIQYLKREKILCDDGIPNFIGTPTSFHFSGQQWDYPNAWAPLQMFVIQGLDRTGTPEAQKIAEQLAQNWVHTNYLGYVNDGVIYEKYDARNDGKPGFGGEYPVQKGFGWSNGVILIMLDRYSDSLSFSRNQTCCDPSISNYYIAVQPDS